MFNNYTSGQVHDAYLEVFNSNSGQIVLEDLKHAHYFLSALCQGSALDPLQLAFAEGQRNVILRILTILDSKEQDYVR